ncbi:DUF6083 domain-containing protein [Streptomyces sp. NPDC047049]|uniref:DUF6083 domain-containing protein n=1 Tax=Streptomyces sp. NPDC047049 TaxID=3156688 RepID=UPI0033FE44C3
MRLHRSNASRLLRSKAYDICSYCSCPVEWFDRYDDRRIPLMPKEFPLALIPPKYRWYVDGGVAYTGTLRGYMYCRLAHTTICPALNHDDLDDELQPLVTRLGVRMQKNIEAGQFTPRSPESRDAAEIEEPEPANAAPAGEERHTLRYNTNLRLAPGRIEDLQCIATTQRGQRCSNSVYAADEGFWEHMEIPHAPGRQGELILNATGGMMWVWTLAPLDFGAATRWFKQHCDVHAESPAPEYSPREWVDFHPIKHGSFIVGDKPQGYPEKESLQVPIHMGPKTTRCETASCHNSTVMTVPEGWLCWQCAKRTKRRTAVHSRWQGARSDPPAPEAP